MTARSLVLPLKDSQMLMYIPQAELISHIVMLILRICSRPLYFCSAKRRVSMVVEGGFAVGIGTSLDVDGRVARAGNVVALEAALKLALAEVRDGGRGGIID